MRIRTSRVPPYYDLGTARHRDEADRIIEYLRGRRFDAVRRGRTIRVESSRVDKASAALRANGIELEWAPAPLFQERRVEWPLVIGTVGLGVIGVGATLLLLQNFYWAIVCGIVAPSLALFLVASNHPLEGDLSMTDHDAL